MMHWNAGSGDDGSSFESQVKLLQMIENAIK